MIKSHFKIPGTLLFLAAAAAANTAAAAVGSGHRNIVFILTDDHRFDAMSFMGHPFVETPNLDSLAKNGAHFPNAFVTSSLCSPSRASILTGLFGHHHGVVDNNNPVRGDLVFFPQLLQQAGYKTAFVGKWHMGGESDAPQRGFDRWVSFAGQGVYWPGKRRDGRPFTLNIDGHNVPQKGYITDELTDHALDWLKTVPKEQPFFLYLSHKGVHGPVQPAERHAGRYKDKPVPVPESQTRHEHAPMWVQNQRNSWHGIEFALYTELDFASFQRRYCETLLAVDDSVGRVLAALRERGQLDDTLVVYMGDNGYAFGEHGLIDKRTAYEESMRVPLLAQCPAAFKPGTVVKQVVANIDIAPTLLAAAGVAFDAAHFDGLSFWSLARGEAIAWRSELLYEYYWEHNYPMTPTLFALRGERYKFIRAYGVWDIDELYDLERDPHELKNLIFDANHAKIVQAMREKLFAALQSTGGMNIRLQADRGGVSNLRREGASPPAVFPPELVRKTAPARK
ncbi:MAG: sulfatase [Opitutaceae bacterium]|nr:sulfatase [Opitutaceae bacterium]